MKVIVLQVRWSVKERLRKSMRQVRDAGTKLRYLMIFNVLHGRSCHETAQVLKVHHTTVGRVVKRFEQWQTPASVFRPYLALADHRSHFY